MTGSLFGKDPRGQVQFGLDNLQSTCYTNPITGYYLGQRGTTKNLHYVFPFPSLLLIYIHVPTWFFMFKSIVQTRFCIFLI